MIWLRLQQTLYTNCISESAFGLLSLLFFCFPLLSLLNFCCAKILAQCWFCCFLVSCYRLAKRKKSQTPKCEDPHLSPGRRRDLPQRTGWQIAAGARRACPADAAVAWREGWSPSLCLSPGDVPALWEWDVALLGCLLHSSLNTSVVALHHFVSAPSGGMGGDVWMNCSLCCLLFCPTFAC